MLSIRQRYQEIVRVRRVTEVLARNGLGFLVDQLELTRFLPRGWRPAPRTDRAVARLAVPARLRITLEQLGATFVKIGQLLAGRGDLLPPEFIEELSRLLDAAPPVPTPEIEREIERELGAPVDQLFAHFDPEPIAAASIGQVHRASLSNGDEVVVKVQRPRIEDVVEADLDLLLRQARFLERRSEALRRYNLLAIAEEMAQALRDELDYQIEGRNADRLRSNLQDDARVVVPHVYWDLTSQRVITLQYLEGIKFVERERLVEAGYDLPAIARVVMDVYLKQIFVDGFFHADPHPANLLAVGEKIGLVDMGNVGFLTPATKQHLGDLLLQLLDQDAAGIVRTVVKMGAFRGHPSLDAMEHDIQRLLVRYWGLALEEIKLGQMLGDVFSVAYRHGVYLPGDLALLAKTIITLEGLGLQLDPDIQLVEAARPFAEYLVRERLSMTQAGRRAMRALRQASDLAQDLPRRVDDLWGQLEEGRLTLGIDLRRLEVIISRLNSMVNRLAFSVVVASLIVGSALILHGGKTSWELPILGLGVPVAQIAFVVAVLAGLWLILSMIRSRGL
jgi:ubiquinone biosynthesis protein